MHAQIRHGLHAGLQGTEGRSRLPRQRRSGVAKHLRVGRQGSGVPFGWELHNAGPRCDVEEGRQHGRAAHPVEDGVVHLGHQCRALPLQALDHVHLPEWAVRIQLAAHDAGDEGVELGPASGRRQAGPSEMVVQIEIRVVDPDGVMQAQRDPEGSLPQRGDQMETLLNDTPDLRVTGGRRKERPGTLGRVQDERHPDVHRRGGCLQGEEGGIHADE